MATQTQSILRNGLNARSVVKTGASRSVLRRPEPLALSPRAAAFAQVANYSVQVSPPKSQAIKSPHVHFPPSPSQLISTFTAYSSGSYDRAPISISPNPLALPGWGERVFSPSIDGFRLQPVPKAFRTLSYVTSPAITEFEDPRSPKLPAVKVSNRTAANTIRFASIVSTRGATRPSQSLEKALSSYPRSPYPSAPITPTEVRQSGHSGEADEMDTRGRQMARSGEIPSGSARARARAQSVQERRHSKKNLTLAPPCIVPAPNSPPPKSSFIQPTSSLKRPHKPAPLDSLSQEFWQAVSLQPTASEASSDLDEPMVTALEYPESAVEYEEKLDITVRSASQPPLMYAGADGALWSPGLPKPGATLEKIREGLMSPGVSKPFGSMSTIVRKDFTAPSPNDPFAAFPSFAAALSGAGLQYPPPVVRV